MRSGLTRKLATAWPIQFWEDQLTDLRSICQETDGEKNINSLGRTGAAFLIRATQLNGGIVPDPRQIFIRRMLTKRAARDARRK